MPTLYYTVVMLSAFLRVLSSVLLYRWIPTRWFHRPTAPPTPHFHLPNVPSLRRYRNTSPTLSILSFCSLKVLSTVETRCRNDHSTQSEFARNHVMHQPVRLHEEPFRALETECTVGCTAVARANPTVSRFTAPASRWFFCFGGETLLGPETRIIRINSHFAESDLPPRSSMARYSQPKHDCCPRGLLHADVYAC